MSIKNPSGGNGTPDPKKNLSVPQGNAGDEPQSAPKGAEPAASAASQPSATGSSSVKSYDTGSEAVPATSALTQAQIAVAKNPIAAALDALSVAQERYDCMEALESPKDEPLFEEITLIDATVEALHAVLGKPLPAGAVIPDGRKLSPLDRFNEAHDRGMSFSDSIMTVLQSDQSDFSRSFALSLVFEPVPEGPEFWEQLDAFSSLLKQGVSVEAVLAASSTEAIYEVGKHLDEVHAAIRDTCGETDGLPWAIERMRGDNLRRVYNHSYLKILGSGTSHDVAVREAESLLNRMSTNYR